MRRSLFVERRLFGAEGVDGIDGGGTAAGEIAGDVGGKEQACGDSKIGDGVDGIDVEEERGH